MKEYPFRKKSWLSKFLLKLKNKQQYKLYKWELQNYKQEQFYQLLTGEERIDTPDKMQEICQANNNRLSFRHSGNAGDVIYALPTVKRIQELTGAQIDFYLNLGKPLVLSGYTSHPVGNTMLNDSMASMLKPLLSCQNYISTCEIYTGQAIHIDLDYFRSGVVPLDRTNIARWCGYMTGVNPKLWKSWLDVPVDNNFSNSIVIARSERYRNISIDYSFLREYKNLIFIGVESEYKDIRRSVPNIEWIQVDNFLKLASIIAGSKFFIGNQSFPYSIAEALKVPRILEAHHRQANVIPEGENSYDFFFQQHFEWLVEHMASQ